VIQVGLAILRAIQEIGLVLAPEVLTWKQSLENGEYRTITLRQRRICFTELARSEVQEHGKKFGPYALELRVNDLRRLGALPVMYIPQHLKDDRKLSTVGATVVAELADIKYTISQLHQLSQLTDPSYLLSSVAKGSAASVVEDCVLNLQNTDPLNKVVASYQVPLKNVKDFLSYIGYRNAPFELMVGVLSFVQSLFYPTDDEIHDTLLEYYRQREWRLVSGLAIGRAQQCRQLTEGEKKMLVSLDTRFWTEEVSDDRGSFRRIDDAVVIHEFEGKHITHVISRIIVPPEAVEKASAIFGDKVLVLEES
jgi:hypothetical protein